MTGGQWLQLALTVAALLCYAAGCFAAYKAAVGRLGCWLFWLAGIAFSVFATVVAAGVSIP